MLNHIVLIILLRWYNYVAAELIFFVMTIYAQQQLPWSIFWTKYDLVIISLLLLL